LPAPSARWRAGGLAVAVADHRGYGKSTGTPRFGDLLDDARRVLAAFTDERGAANVVLFGRSLGSQAALHALTDTTPAAVVIDSGFSSLDAFVARRGLPPSTITVADRALRRPAASPRLPWPATRPARRRRRADHSRRRPRDRRGIGTPAQPLRHVRRPRP
jgi:alpha-beta hydrolase superfamily lysophospholipase